VQCAMDQEGSFLVHERYGQGHGINPIPLEGRTRHPLCSVCIRVASVSLHAFRRLYTLIWGRTSFYTWRRYLMHAD
jgi:hypothetical protein